MKKKERYLKIFMRKADDKRPGISELKSEICALVIKNQKLSER